VSRSRVCSVCRGRECSVVRDLVLFTKIDDGSCDAVEAAALGSKIPF
jgi:hypothetical protein